MSEDFPAPLGPSNPNMPFVNSREILLIGRTPVAYVLLSWVIFSLFIYYDYCLEFGVWSLNTVWSLRLVFRRLSFVVLSDLNSVLCRPSSVVCRPQKFWT